MNEFARYLAAKKAIDDRSLNAHVRQTLFEHLPEATAVSPLRILEIGAGIGAMIRRLNEYRLLPHTRVTAIDAAADNIAVARRRLTDLPPTCRLELEAIDLFDFIPREQGRRTWDLLIAHAFLDLIDLAGTLPQLFKLLSPGGLFYFTLNFDGATILEPAIDADLDAQIEAFYHQTMDERVRNGRVSGDSRSGRHLFHHLRQNEADILAAGSSDWVVFAGPDGYPPGEADFLHFIIRTIESALSGHPQLDAARFDHWIAQRLTQIETGELVYIAHQIDFVGRKKQLSSAP